MQKQEMAAAKYFKWWYLKDAKKDIKYPDLLKAQTVSLIAMTRDDQFIKKEVALKNEKGIAIVDLGEQGRFYLSPNQWVSPTRSERIKNFWLTDKNNHFDSPLINGVYDAIEDDKGCFALPEGVTLFGKTNRNASTLARRSIEAIVPIGENEYIAWDGNFVSIVGDRETDDSVIKILLERIL